MTVWNDDVMTVCEQSVLLLQREKEGGSGRTGSKVKELRPR